MAGGLFVRLKNWAFGENIGSSDLNSEFNNIINNFSPDKMASYSATVSQMQQQVTPGAQGSESLAISTADELTRLRFVLNRIIGGTYWYDAPAISLASVNNLVSAPQTVPQNRIISGKTLGTSNQPAFLVANGATLAVTLKGASTPFIYEIAGTQYTINSDVNFTCTAAPGTATAAVNDAALAGADITKIQGEGSSVLTFGSATANWSSSMPSNTYQSFKLTHGGSDEFAFGYLPSSTIFSKCFRGFFFDSASTPVSRLVVSNADVLTALRTNWIFATISGTLDACITNPVWSFNQPTGSVNGDYWFDLNSKVWKKFGAGTFNVANATLIGIAVCDNTKCVGSRSFDFWAAYSDINTSMFEILDNNNAISTQIGSTISVAGNTIRFEKGLITLNMPTDLIAPFTEAASTNYYIYIKDNGAVILDPTYPYERANDLLGKYHPYNPWRNVGYIVNDGSSNFSVAVSEYYPNADKIAQSMTPVGANAIVPNITSSAAWGSPTCDVIAQTTSSIGANALYKNRTKAISIGVAAQGNIAESKSTGALFSSTSISFVDATVGTPPTFPSTNVNTGTSTINLNSHGMVTGEQFKLTNGSTLPSPLAAGIIYYAIFVDANNFKVASSYANAVAGTFITLTTQGSGTNSLYYLLAVTITTNSRPVKISLVPDGSGLGMVATATSGGATTLIGSKIQFVQGASTVVGSGGLYCGGASSSGLYVSVPPGGFTAEDTQAFAGAYQYRVQVEADSTGSEVQLQYVRLRVEET